MMGSMMFVFEHLDKIDQTNSACMQTDICVPFDACTPIDSIIGSETYKSQMERLAIDSNHDPETHKGREDHTEEHKQRMYVVWNMWSEKLSGPDVDEIEKTENIICCGMCEDEDHYIDNSFRSHSLSHSGPSIHPFYSRNPGNPGG